MSKYFTDSEIQTEIKQAIIGIARRCGVKDNKVINEFKKLTNYGNKD